jgi:hypothetical protein
MLVFGTGYRYDKAKCCELIRNAKGMLLHENEGEC